MKNLKLKTLITLSLICIASSLFADKKAEPIFIIESQGNLPTTIMPGESVRVSYIITNNMQTTLQANGLYYAPSGKTPIGVVQNTTVESSPPTCPDPFTLTSHASCTLVLDIAADNLVNNIAKGGPEVCNSKDHPVRCAIPDPDHSLNIKVSNLLQITAGTGAHDTPLLVDSQDNGLTWQNATSRVPGMPNNVMFNTATCNIGTTCIVAGQDKSGGISGNNPPLLITTLDAGVTWNRVTSILDSNNQPIAFPLTGRFDGGSCSGNNCVLTGVSFSEGEASILYNSTDAGVSWYQRSITNIEPTIELYGSDCNQDSCVIVGEGVNPPLLATSSDGGVSWNLISSLADGVSFPQWAVFNQADPSCGDNICITGGFIQDHSQTFPLPQPFLISSVNSLNSWNQVTEVTNGLPVIGNFNGYSCSGENCVAVGMGIRRDSFDAFLLIVVTTNGGTTWTRLTQLSADTPLPAGLLSHVSCYDTNCVAGGDLLLFASSDSGLTWKQITSAEGGFPTQGVFNSIGCTLNICMAAGGDIEHPPYLLVSLDSGNTWKNVTVGENGLPAGGDLNIVSTSR